MTWEFAEVRDGTQVCITAENVPDGVSAQDHRAGMESSLKQLAAYLDG